MFAAAASVARVDAYLKVGTEAVLVLLPLPRDLTDAASLATLALCLAGLTLQSVLSFVEHPILA